ncbi:MAG: META domain-containing protein, partial [Candidatus Kapaibacterium sp.]
MLGYRDTLELSLKNSDEIQYTDWRITENNSSQPFYGYMNNYKVNDKRYDRLDVYSDFTPTYYDGPGLVFVYNSNYGLVRHYAMNPWLGDVNGFDLVRNNPKPNSLVGSDWRLKSVVYNDGSVKSIEEIYWGDNTIKKDPNFTLMIKSETEVFGSAGCNEFGGQYTLDGN